MNRAVSVTLWAGTLLGVGLCAFATVAGAAGAGGSAGLARAGVLALYLTPPFRLAVAAVGFARERRFALAGAAAAVLAALVAAALHALRA
ncbi:MAG TPA: DUF1634 domain-containing protein [Anaeromyxobacteraceae bacterium]|nr:DUF1634 domain-containing protein [Anaeromyxobacteraceae bacterium]